MRSRFVELGLGLALTGAAGVALGASGCSGNGAGAVGADSGADASAADTGAPDAGPGASGPCSTEDQRALRCPTLTDYPLFLGSGATQQPATGVVPYDVIAPLYADGARKKRFLYLPPGTKAGYREGAPWELPTGSVLVKTFALPIDARDPAKGERLVETRLVARGEGGYTAVSYVWNEAQTEARRALAGADVPLRWTDEGGKEQAVTYAVPDANRCLRCHGAKGALPLGLRTEQLDRTADFPEGAENQIDRFARLGLLDGSPPAGPRTTLVSPSDTAATNEARTRSYLFANCAHCHSPTRGAAEWSGLSLELADTAASAVKPCRIVTSAGDTGGLTYDIVPGHPEQSILPYRMALQASAYRMPEGSRTPDPEGVALVNAWIAAMPARTCP